MAHELSVENAGVHLPHVVESVQTLGEPVYFTQDGRRVAALLSARDLEALLAAAVARGARGR
ncbi:type II toxin-antitoxin system prevent-host-death family antitoxin [Dermacoccus nishinomiyaensis]